MYIFTILFRCVVCIRATLFFVAEYILPDFRYTISKTMKFISNISDETVEGNTM